MKFLLLTLLVAAIPLPALAELPALRVNGNMLETAQGEPVTLRGVSLCSLSWHNPMQLMDGLTGGGDGSGWNVNAVRLPVQPQEWRRLGAYAYIHERLNPAVEKCREKGMYCIIDWHDIADWDTKETRSGLENFWRVVAPRYADEPFILYEIFNEPIGPKKMERENWLAFRAQMQKWVDMVRADAPDTVLLVGSPHWSQMPGFAASDPLDGDNLVYVAHIYGGWPAETWDGLFGEASASIPLFISEWGWSSLIQNRLEPFYGTLKDYAEPLRAYLDARPHISWTAWSYDPECGPAMLGKDKEMGGFVYEWLETYRKEKPSPVIEAGGGF